MSISTEQRPHKCPVGTIRSWQKGMVIKLHDATDYHNGWYDIPNFPVLTALGHHLDGLAREFVKVKEPIDGETFLDEVIKNFKRLEGQDHGPFSPTDFKQYEGFYGALKYSFTNEFTKRAMKLWQEMYNEIQDRLLQASAGGTASNDVIKIIKQEVKAKYKAQLEKEVDVTEFKQLGSVIDAHYDNLVEATNLSPELQKQYDKFKKQYVEKIKKGRGDEYFHIVDILNEGNQFCVENFSGNWILFQTQLDKLAETFEDYLEGQSSEIKKYIENESVRRFNVDVFADPHTFYSDIIKKLQNTEVFGEAPETDSIIGDYDIELNGIKGSISVNVEKKKEANNYNGDDLVVVHGSENIMNEVCKYIGQRGKKTSDGFTTIKYQEPDHYSLGTFYTTSEVNKDKTMQSFASLLAIINKFPTPTADAFDSFKRFYLTGKEISSYYIGKKLDFTIGFDDPLFGVGESKIPQFEKPVLSLSNIKDANKLETYFTKKFKEVGFSAEEGKKQFKKYVDANKFPLSKYDLKVIFIDLTNKGAFQKSKLDFKPVLQMRFNTKYNKQIEGNWNKSNLVALETIEKLIDTLPKGHVISNKELTTFMYNNEYNKSYAFYDPDRKKIQFSPDCLRSTSKVTKLDGSDHFASVVTHELGHAVSKKLDRYSNQEYRKFANECGWSYKEERTKDHATGEDVRIPRNGQNSHRDLITDYAHVAPEEAFAEYYSFYHLNKPTIDKYLDTGDVNVLKQHTARFITEEKKLKYQDAPFSKMGTANVLLTGENKAYDMVQKDFVRNNFKDELDHKVTSISPWTIKFEKPFSPEHTRKLLATYRSSTAGLPVFVIDNGNDTYESIEHRPAYNQDNIIEANRFAQRNQPVITISRRAYEKLSEKYPGDLIAEMMAKKFRDTPLPEAQKIEKVETSRTGLWYTGHVIDHAVISSSHDILNQMRKLYHSDELKKAVKGNIQKTNNGEESASISTISTFFKSFKDAVGNILDFKRKKPKNNYADLIILTQDLRVLLVQRDPNDDFMPGKLALPGGKIEEGELPIHAAIRETFEEINIVFDEKDIRYAETYNNLNKSKSYYFYILLNKDFVLEDHLVLDTSEQRNYQLLSIDKFGTDDIPSELFILDLKARLNELFENNIEKFTSPTVLIDVTPEINIKTQHDAVSYIMYNFDRNEIQEDLFIQTLIDHQEILDDGLEKGKTPFPIGSLDKNKKNVKTATGWVPIKGNHHLIHPDYKHLLEKEKQQTATEKEIEQVKVVEQQNVDINLPPQDKDGSLKNAEEVSEKPKRVPSPQQQGIFDFIQLGKGNGVIDAKAGTGKTTTIVDSMKFIPLNKKIIFVAFSNAIATELKPRIGTAGECSTLHSFGFSAIKKVYGKYVKFEKDKKKLVLNNYLDNIATEQKLEQGEKIEFMSNVYRLIGIGQQNLTAEPELLIEQARRQGIELVSNEAQYVRNCMRLLDARTEMIDFDDMIYLPAAYDKFNVSKYDYVFVDECQDLNKTQLKLVTRMFNHETGGRLMAVGDPQQAIFGFAGSDHESFENIANLPNTQRLPLSVSYRCAKSIVNYARQTTGVPIDFWENSPEGEVNLDASVNDIGDGDMVICRNTAPLISLCMKYIGEKKAAYIRGRDIGETMINEIQRYVGKKLMDSEEGFGQMYDKIQNEIEKIIRKQVLRGLTREQALESNPVVNLTERRECYEALRGDSSTPNHMVENIKKIFSESQKGGIQLTTAHRSKGLEAEKVYIVEDELLHGGRVKNEFQRIQENNLRYVAYTRAKKKLGIVNDWFFYTKIKKAIGLEAITVPQFYDHNDLNKSIEYFDLLVEDINDILK